MFSPVKELDNIILLRKSCVKLVLKETDLPFGAAMYD